MKSGNIILSILALTGSLALLSCGEDHEQHSSTPAPSAVDSARANAGRPGDQDQVVFKGEFVSQEKLADGTYAITFLEQGTKEKILFKSDMPFDETSVNNFLPGYTATIEFDVRNNRETGTADRYLKNAVPVSIVGAQRAPAK